MMNSTPFFKRPLANVRTGVVAAFFIVALIGFADATFLTVEHYRGVIPPCTTAGCDTVLTSAYSVIAGIPVSLLGAIFYLAMVIGSFIYLEYHVSTGGVAPHHLTILKWTMFGTVFGLVASAYFIFLQAAVIGSWCQYCIGSAVTSTLLFVIAVYIIRKHLV